MKSLLLLSMLLVVGCAETPRRPITGKLTPLPTLAHPHAWLTKEYPETHCTAYLNVDATAQRVTWLEQTWEIPTWGAMMACPGRVKVCETTDLSTCRDVAPPSHPATHGSGW